MTTPARVVAFLAALAVAFLGARVVGSAVGPLDVEPVAHEEGGHEEGGHAGGGHAVHERGAAAPAGDVPGGLQVSSEGRTLRVLDAPRAGEDRLLRFVVEGPDGQPVTTYDEVHERRLHLVVVRRDGTGFQHVHPTLDDDGSWRVRVDLTPGSHRVLADFTPTGGPGLVLGTDVEVPGRYRPATPAPLDRTARVGRYRVELVGSLETGGGSPVTARITRGGEPVTDLQPYLGAYGHLVALREGDLAYLHVHPEEAGPGPEVPFVAEVPSEGRYRMFLDFRHRGVVRTAGFVLRTGDAPTGGDAPSDDAGGGDVEGGHAEGGDHDH